MPIVKSKVFTSRDIPQIQNMYVVLALLKGSLLK